MASVTSTITEEFLTCSICFEIYKDPKTLPCLHSFCKDCINKLRQEKAGKNSYPCPICRELFQLPEDGADDLKTNFCLKNLIDFVTSTKEVKKLCSFCRIKGETIDATSLCLTCNDLLCPECADHRHRSTTLTLHHRVVPLAEVTAGKYNDEIRSKQQIPCSKHEGEDLRFFCETCDIPVCRDCIVLGHQNHKCLAPSDARKHMDENLNSLMDLLNQKIKTFQDAKEKVVTCKKKIETEKKKVEEDLENQTSALIKKITDSKQAVEKEFNHFLKSKQDDLNQQREYIESEKKLLNETYSFCSNILRCGSDIEVLAMKTEMKERLSKLQFPNDTGMCNVREIVLPDIQFCNDENVFKMVVKLSDEETKTSMEQGLKDSTQMQEGAYNDVKATCVFPYQSKQFFEKEDSESQKPLYTSVAWVDEDTITVVDQRNQKLKLVLRGHGVVKTTVIKNCITVCAFKNGLACRTEDSTLYVFNSSLELQKVFSSVSTLLTCHSHSLDVFWISGLTKICKVRDNDVKEVAITHPNRQLIIGLPMFGHVLLNEMFAVSDWQMCCVILIRKSGYIERRKYFDSNPGSISSDFSNTLYVCELQRNLIVNFTLGGETLRSFKIGGILPNPRSIAINRNDKILIANSKSFLEVEFANMGKIK